MNLIISLDEGIDIEKPLDNKLNKIVSTILDQEKMSDCVINLRLLNDKEMRKLNMQFRQKDKTTNVLSFPNDDISVKQTKNIGDIAASVGVRHLWMQPGAESPAALRRCAELGIDLIAGGPCLLVVLGFQE